MSAARTVKVKHRWVSVKPSPESIARYGAYLAEQRGGTYVATSSLKVGRTRSRSTCWDATITIEVPA